MGGKFVVGVVIDCGVEFILGLDVISIDCWGV